MSEGRSKICSVCTTNISKYRCPGCETSYCSLNCNKTHKGQTKCSGQRDPTKFIPKNQLVGHLNSDYNFLTGLEKVLEKKEKEESSPIHRLDRNRTQLKRTIEKTGINIHLAPPSFKKRKENRTHFDRRKRHIVWTIEWQLHNDSIQGTPTVVCLTHQNNENESIDKLWEKCLQENKDKLSIDLSKFQLDNHPKWVMKARRSASRGDIFRKVSPFIPISSVLQKAEIFEFPTIHVLPGEVPVITLSDYETSSEEEETSDESESESSDSESSSDGIEGEDDTKKPDLSVSNEEYSVGRKETPISNLETSSIKREETEAQRNATDVSLDDVLSTSKAKSNSVEDSTTLPPLFGAFFQKKD
ncbi:snoRNA biogenesis protein [Schizosaccharomyces octosporus yFS286]|uniref:SnoRNA biogenesis protein n=1 Tax=Schizosaccharomyces octosporus (strain yFS286) TaxID=483514 RepID=S9R8M4_SCHOY|nr:snoRNA biogenesis protein [Schizosaccharomyces octosporus yFS286]EPX70439.1 snoRNA biogenesis protein [Schizosaccharomyces octosporus yFS286]